MSIVYSIHPLGWGAEHYLLTRALYQQGLKPGLSNSPGFSISSVLFFD
jgi:hypothetical protein